MKVLTTRPVSRALNLAALAGACSALTLAAGAPTAVADCRPCHPPPAASLQQLLPVYAAPSPDPRPVHFMPIDVGPFAHRPVVVEPSLIGAPAVPPADREPSEQPPLLPPVPPPATSPSATPPVPPPG